MIARFLDWLFPMRSLKAWGQELADWEASTEVWEPDELWAAQKMSAAPPTADRAVAQWPGLSVPPVTGPPRDTRCEQGGAHARRPYPPRHSGHRRAVESSPEIHIGTPVPFRG